MYLKLYLRTIVYLLIIHEVISIKMYVNNHNMTIQHTLWLLTVEVVMTDALLAMLSLESDLFKAPDPDGLEAGFLWSILQVVYSY